MRRGLAVLAVVLLGAAGCALDRSPAVPERAGARDAGPDARIAGADGGPRTPDAGTPRRDAGPVGHPDAGLRDAGLRDAGLRDAGPRDAGPPDAGPPDAGPPDAGRRRCADIYGAAPGYTHCDETPTACEFSAATSGSDCRDMCSRFGGTCLEAYDNADDPCRRRPEYGDTCDTNRSTEICVCSR